MSVDLIYGAVTGLLRSIVVPAPGHLVRGECVLTVTDEQYASFSGLTSIQAYVNSVIGGTPVNYRSVMVDQVGNVISVHYADPGCDHPFPGHRLMWDEAAEVGWLAANGSFVPLPPRTRRNFKSPRTLRR